MISQENEICLIPTLLCKECIPQNQMKQVINLSLNSHDSINSESQNQLWSLICSSQEIVGLGERERNRLPERGIIQQHQLSGYILMTGCKLLLGLLFFSCYLYDSLVFQDIHNPVSKFHCIISWGAVNMQKTFYERFVEYMLKTVPSVL